MSPRTNRSALTNTSVEMDEKFDLKVEKFVSQIPLDELCNPENNYQPVLPKKSGKNCDVARAANSFFQFKPVVTQYAIKHKIKGYNDQSILSKAQSRLWKKLSVAQKEPFKRLYEEAVEYQKKNFPDYKFKPQRQKSDLKIKKMKQTTTHKRRNRKSADSDTDSSGDQLFSPITDVSSFELNEVNYGINTDFRQEDVTSTTNVNAFYPANTEVHSANIQLQIPSFSYDILDFGDGNLSQDSGVFLSYGNELSPVSPASSDGFIFPNSGAFSPALSCSSSFTDESSNGLSTVQYGDNMIMFMCGSPVMGEDVTGADTSIISDLSNMSLNQQQFYTEENVYTPSYNGY
ncbi:10799_t:CDS:1 [Acaulospora morrowiae]|uniref:10799_t:CDS:1 n=1 Tax=Acaulospora morrowiae TaxID=94023 RepID=A0A9N9ERS1_9GLOM|nr:10799_t:CDS:1 [Acaulospora morrowiae]